MSTLTTEPHPIASVAAFITHYPAPIGELEVPAWLRAFFSDDVQTPVQRSEDTRKAVRDLLRHGGFKPTGRNKPASEYLIKALEKGWFGPDKGINLAVDACNVVSLHSGLPISVLDADRATSPWRVAVCPPDTRYVFNPSGQTIDIGGLLTLHDAEGPCGGPVKDSQRTKTHDGTTRTLSIIWGTDALPGHTDAALTWYRDLLHRAGAETTRLEVS